MTGQPFHELFVAHAEVGFILDLPEHPHERPARVVSVGRNAVRVAYENEATIRVASLQKHLERLSLVPGDLVRAAEIGDDRLVVTAREPRASEVTRTTLGGRRKTMAANVDALAIVAALAQPALHRTMLDELLAFAELQGLHAFVIFTKPDLAAADTTARLAATYGALSSGTFVVSPIDGLGVDAVDAALARHRTLIIGQSGVGKSSLFGHLGGDSEIGDLSRFGRGRQTTTSGRLHRFVDGFVIDSPGVGDFTLAGLTPAELAPAFIEFRPFLGTCRFTDCTHRSEPECAIRAAVAGGGIDPLRYASFLEILAR